MDINQESIYDFDKSSKPRTDVKAPPPIPNESYVTDPNSSQYMKNIDKPIFKNATPSVSEKSGLEQNMQSNVASTINEPQSKPMSTPPPVVPTLNLATQSGANPGEKAQMSEREKAGLESTFAKK